MSRTHASSPRRNHGFTLVEAIAVIVLLGLASVAIANIQGGLFSNRTNVDNLQVRARLMEECAEQVLATRRTGGNGYDLVVAGASFGTNACGGLTALAGQTVPTVGITDPFTGSACPSGASCKTVAISLSGVIPITLMLVNY